MKLTAFSLNCYHGLIPLMKKASTNDDVALSYDIINTPGVQTIFSEGAQTNEHYIS